MTESENNCFAVILKAVFYGVCPRNFIYRINRIKRPRSNKRPVPSLKIKKKRKKKKKKKMEHCDKPKLKKKIRTNSQVLLSICGTMFASLSSAQVCHAIASYFRQLSRLNAGLLGIHTYKPLFNRKRGFIAHSLSLSPRHRPDRL